MKNARHWRACAPILLACALGACAQTPPDAASANLAVAPAGRGIVSGPHDWRDEVIYFAFTDRFANGDVRNDNGTRVGPGEARDPGNPLGWHGGDWAGIRQKIQEGYFRKLGVTAIWVSPVVLQTPPFIVRDSGSPNDGRAFTGYHGYWAEDFFKTDPHYGTLADLRALVKTAHQHGLKVIQDVVVNHAGYGASLTRERPEWFHTDAECQASADKDRDCPLAGLPDFKQDDPTVGPAVTAYLNDFIRFWVARTGVDGLRMDTMKHVPDGYWRQFFAPDGPGDPGRIWTVGEVYNGDPAVLAHYMDALGSPSVFDFALYFSMKDNLSSGAGSLDAVADVFARDTAYRDATRLTTFVDNHDVKRFVTEVTDRGGSALEARERLDLALSLMFMARGTPSVYYGTEIAMPGSGDPYSAQPGLGNREDMDFAAVPSSPVAERLARLAAARRASYALTHGAQQELWRPNGGAPILAFRRVVSPGGATRGAQPVVVVANNGNASVNLADLPGGGIPLLGTFAGRDVTEVTGRASSLSVTADGKLVGVVPPRTLLAVTAPAGTGTGTRNPSLGNVTDLTARPGDAAVKLAWTPATDANVTGYRVYQRRAGDAAFQLVNFAPVPAGTTSFLLRALANGSAYEFRVVSVDAQGAESTGATATATPSAGITVPVTFTVDARTQGNGALELRRFDTGTQLEYALVETTRGVWSKTIDLPLFREVKFKFGNDAPNAKNAGYEGPGQGDRTLVVDDGVTYAGVYDFISVPVPAATVTGRVTSGPTGLPRATVNAEQADLQYALTFADGSFVLRATPGGRALTASAPGFRSETLAVTAPAENVTFDLAVDAGTKYAIDGQLSDWTTPLASLVSPTQGLWGADNDWLTLRVDADASFLYLAYTYRASGNSAIVYLDVRPGGVTDVSGLNAWPRKATFTDATAVEYFVARYGTERAQLWRTDATSGGAHATEVTGDAVKQAASSQDGTQTVEVAIPWTTLGFGGRPAGPVNVYAGIFGDNYGAGDVVPNAQSTPAGSNPIDPSQSYRVSFGSPLSVALP